MREILFKAKRIDNGEWVYGQVIKVTPYKNKDGWRICTQDSWDMVPIVTETLCQFTGMNNKNGVKIFEGDIVLDEENYIGVISYNESGLWCLDDIDGCYCENLIEMANELIVTGNIHDKEVE
jgi:uncharacterized phage protein (TIGR01671 family)